MKNKGFTLAELLAVIVILAIILAIAVPTITSLIESSRLQAYLNSEKMVERANLTFMAANMTEITLKPTDIKITKINDTSNNTKNILFEITDQELLKETGGIVQGMSGSPIIQGEYIVGAVTHVVIDNPSTGYGIFITNMLEESEK